MTKQSSKQETTSQTSQSNYEKKVSEHYTMLCDPVFVGQQRTATEKAWSRMGLDLWSQMMWFVKLANTSGFDAMTEGEQLLWKEEFVAMWGKRIRGLIEIPHDTKRYPRPSSSPEQVQYMGIAPPSPDDMEEVRDVIAEHINDLADDKGTRIGAFNISYTIDFYKNPAYDQNKEPNRYIIYRGETAGPVYNFYRQNLLLHASKLLEEYANRLRRCEHCEKVFLQVKRTAKYCGSKCYTVAEMRRLRAERKTQTALKRKNKKPGPKTSARGGSRHGKKKR